VAHIGCGGMGGSDVKSIAGTKKGNVVALCDVQIDSSRTKGAKTMHPKAAQFQDFRKMFDKMAGQIEVCTVSLPDHAHFPVAMLAMSLGKHVYVQKPLAHTFQECELLMAAEKKYKVACQMGNQGHSGGNYYQFKAWVEAGIIKDVTKIVSCMNNRRRWHGWKIDGYPTGETMPKDIDWDTRLATAQERPFSSKLHPGNWRSWYDFGNGAFGDWGPHILDTAHRFLNLGLPSKITAVKREGPNKWIFPQGSTIRFDFPARGSMPPCEVFWYDGTKNKPAEKSTPEGKSLPSCGKLIYGKDLTFVGGSHSGTLKIVGGDRAADVKDKLPKYGGGSNHHANLMLAAQGKEKTRSRFAVSGPLTQTFCLGVIAQRLGGELEFDRKTKQITNNKLANDLLAGPPPRKDWEKFYRL